MSKKSRRRPDRTESQPEETDPTESTSLGLASPAAVGEYPAAGLRPGGLRGLWLNVRDFSGWGGVETHLWVRWLVLRAVGLVYVLIFAGIIQDGMALSGPHGLVPVTDYLAYIRSGESGAVSAFFGAPSLFWIASGEGMIRTVSWLGLAAAVAVVLNWWPRMALLVCWATFLTFVSIWPLFSAAQLDVLMLESALLCIFFAPRGFRPGLGANSPPPPLTVFMMRWFLFRVMFESGIVKLVAGDPHWRDFSAMDVMYETSPFPTLLGYFDHQLPRAYHVLEILFTFFAELGAPLLALFGGRRGRWIAFFAWTLFQAGIQLTNNFGWLNTASLGLGLLLLDDQMLAGAVEKLRLPSVARWLVTRATPATPLPTARWLRYGSAGVLWLQFSVTLFFFAKVCGAKVYDLSPLLNAPVKALTAFGSANEYHLYARFETVRHQIEFLGSNDGGQTWRPYEYRYLPQFEDQICPFIAPWFARFDASLQIAGFSEGKSRLVPITASHLLIPDPATVGLFRRNPFPDAPPTLLRMQRYRLKFTSLATRSRTGRYWTKEPAGDYLPPLRVDEQGRIVAFDLSAGETELQRGNISGALAIFARQYRQGYLAAGFRLADLYLQGPGISPEPAKAFALFTELAQAGEVGAEHNLGICYEHGVGVAEDVQQAAHWYRRAASHGYPLAYYTLGALYASDRLLPRNDVEALAALLKAAELAGSGDPASNYIHENQPALVQKLTARMNPAQIERAHAQAAR